MKDMRDSGSPSYKAQLAASMHIVDNVTYIENNPALLRAAQATETIPPHTATPSRATAMTSPQDSLPLAGIRIIDLTSAVVGPYATQILADYGAEVIKVEEKGGDIIRWISGRSPTPGMSAKFMHMNRNKRSISLDLKKPAGKAALLKLVAGADVFVHNMRIPAITKLGLGFDDLKKVNDKLVYCGIVGFGQNGRYRHLPAYDSILQGGTGLASLFARNGGEPRYVPYVVIDRTAGLMVVHNVLAALFKRERAGGACEIQIPMFESYLSLLLSEHLYGKSFEPPVSGAGDARLLDANARPVKTQDGYVCITTNTDAQVLALFDAFGRPELKQDKRFNTSPSRIEHIAEFFALRASEIAKQPTNYWVEALQAHDIPVMPCHTIDSVLQDPHVTDVGLLEMVEHPTQGRMWNINVASKMSGFTPSIRHPAPHVGEQTAEILREIGYTEAEIAQALAEGAAYSARG